MLLYRRKRAASILLLIIMSLALLPMQNVQAADVVATVAGSFQKALGCSEDWQPQCDASRLRDADGDGIYTFNIPAGTLSVGNYEYKVTLDHAWDESYPPTNQAFNVASEETGVTFFFNPTTKEVRHQVTGATAPDQDNTIYWDGLAHNSRDPLYRTPAGAQPADSLVTLRFRTFHDDAEQVTLRTYHTGLQSEALYPMEVVARNVDCYAPNLPFVCDFWQTTINVSQIGTLYYRFVVQDGTRTVYYEDDSEVRDGGWGNPFDQSPDWGWAISVYDPAFALPIQWMKEGVVYQIFPDRFRNGDLSNDPTPDQQNTQLSTDPRYAYPNGEEVTDTDPQTDQIVRMPWGALPEGYCRNYQDLDPAECPQRYAQPGDGKEEPRGRDYYGGDLQGVTEKLDYLKGLGVTIIYFTPIFAAGSNHRYDTRDFHVIDSYLGDMGDWETLVREAEARGIRIILDGVFNHMSSDSPIFDRYGNWGGEASSGMPSNLPEKVYLPLAIGNGAAVSGAGACESIDSAYRDWFRFRPPNESEPAVCAPDTRDGPSYYNPWAGFDSLPQLSESDEVRDYIYGADDSVARYWIQQGASGWRLDVMQDKSLPFWQEFRERVKDVDPEAIIIGELWKKFDVLPYVTGTTADTAMNYRLRDAVLGLLAPQSFDAKGFPGSGEPISPSAFVDRLESIREDYPDAAYYALMNLLDSHDTERLLWTLTPGAENPSEREENAADVAEGKQRQRVAALIQMTMPGAPTIYYGDEVGLTGDDDPDNRRTYPWGDVEGDARQPDTDLLAYYTSLTTLRRENGALVNGDLQFLLADDASGTVAYGRKFENSAAITVINASKESREALVPVAGYLPSGTLFAVAAGCGEAGARVPVEGGVVKLQIDPLCGVVLTSVDADLTPTVAPAGLTASATDLTVELNWTAVEGASGYSIYRSPVSGGGYVKIKAVDAATTTYLDANDALTSGQRYFYIVKAMDDKGSESAAAPEASAVPTYTINWANLQRPAALRYTVSAKDTTEHVYGQVYIEGVTRQQGPTLGLVAQVGYGPQNSDPREWVNWVAMDFHTDVGNNDEYRAVLQPTVSGTYSYLVRYSTDGETWIYADLDGIGDGSFAQQTNALGTLDVIANQDQTPSAAPVNLQASNKGATSIGLMWEAVSDPALFRYEIYRSTTAGSHYLKVGQADKDTTAFTDIGLQTGTRYYYIVRAVDEANNLSSPSGEATAVPQPLPVEVTFEVEVPEGTPAEGSVFIVGTEPEICDWCNPQTAALAKGEDGKWRVTITFQEGTPIEYKFTLGSWDTVEKDATCNEVANRQVRAVPDANGTQTIRNTVANWRNVAPCGS